MKVEFGLSNVHVGSYTVGEDGEVTLGTPMHIPGAVGLTLEEESELYQFFADDGAYYSEYTGASETGELTMALFPDDFKTQFLGYVKTDDGGVAKVKGAKKTPIYIVFEGQTDDKRRRHILYNVTCGSITREWATVEDQPEVMTDVLGITVVGDSKTGIVKATYKEGDSGYASLITAPTAPALPTDDSGDAGQETQGV